MRASYFFRLCEAIVFGALMLVVLTSWGVEIFSWNGLIFILGCTFISILSGIAKRFEMMENGWCRVMPVQIDLSKYSLEDWNNPEKRKEIEMEIRKQTKHIWNND